MNFLSKTLSTLTGNVIPYNFSTELVPNPNYHSTIWKIYDGTKKDDVSNVTIFEFDTKARPEYLPLASNYLRKIRALKLPGILKVVDTFENDSNIYIITERVQPLSNLLNSEGFELTKDLRLLIIYSIAVAVKYINVEATSVLGVIDFTNVFINETGDFKLGGFELLTNLKSDPDQPIYKLSSKLPGFNDSLPPEVRSQGVDILRGPQTVKFDSWRLGVFIYKLFNSNDLNEISYDVLNRGANISQPLLTGYKKLISQSLTARASAQSFLKNGESSYFNTDLIHVFKDSEELPLKDSTEKLEFFKSLEAVKDTTPPGFLEKKILPLLIEFFNKSPENAAIALRYILLYSQNLEKRSFGSLVKPIILKAYTIPDRAIRMLLLASLPAYIENLDNSDVSGKVFPNFTTGFSDSNQAIVDETIKGVLLLAPRLTDRQLNNELLRYLAKTQTDGKPEIRTNTTICIGKIAQYLNPSSRATVLATAFSKAMKDPFVHSRLSAIMALVSCIDYFTPQIVCSKVLSVIAPCLLDKNSKVRNEAEKAFDLFFKKIKEEVAQIPVDDDENETTDEAVNQVAESVQNFGLSVSNTINKFSIGGFGGSLTKSNAESPSPPSESRASTPTAFNTMQTVSAQSMKPKITYGQNSWDDEDDPEIVDDPWNSFDDDNETAQLPKLAADKFQPKTIGKPHTRALKNEKKGLQLKPKSKLKLDLDVEDDDGWGDGW